MRGGRGLPLGFSTVVSTGASDGVPTNASAGNLISSGTSGSALLMVDDKTRQESVATSKRRRRAERKLIRFMS